MHGIEGGQIELMAERDHNASQKIDGGWRMEDGHEAGGEWRDESDLGVSRVHCRSRGANRHLFW